MLSDFYQLINNEPFVWLMTERWKINYFMILEGFIRQCGLHTFNNNMSDLTFDSDLSQHFNFFLLKSILNTFWRFFQIWDLGHPLEFLQAFNLP